MLLLYKIAGAVEARGAVHPRVLCTRVQTHPGAQHPACRRGYSLILCLLIGLLSATIAGCADNSPKGPNGADRAQGDPMNYGPHYGRTDIAPKSSDSNDRGSLQKDLDHVLNP
jgi:hypothetical protein